MYYIMFRLLMLYTTYTYIILCLDELITSDFRGLWSLGSIQKVVAVWGLINVYIYIYMYIYIYIERERDVCMYTYMYIYIYISVVVYPRRRRFCE